eukprot:GFUD01065419.1.p1 GENE.GFUD01065419.1~~GFUD01065419.1.p1  ORF type:complete len:105 (-),score=12.89 GFUD01065419.1:52-333(-)
MASVTAGLRCPPDTPPLIQIPIIRASPYPTLMFRNPPKNVSCLAPLPSTTWPTAPSPKMTKAKVPKVSARNSLTCWLVFAFIFILSPSSVSTL